MEGRVEIEIASRVRQGCASPDQARRFISWLARGCKVRVRPGSHDRPSRRCRIRGNPGPSHGEAGGAKFRGNPEFHRWRRRRMQASRELGDAETATPEGAKFEDARRSIGRCRQRTEDSGQPGNSPEAQPGDAGFGATPKTHRRRNWRARNSG